jgi:hypothetical protein
MIFRSPNRLLKPKKQAVTHTRKGRKEDPRCVLVMRQIGANYTVLSGDHCDRRGPTTATGRFLLKKNQLRLIDLALNNISTGNPPTPAFLHKPELEILCVHQKK